jgi:RNase P subunit RPR2
MTFEAKYRSGCEECDDPIIPGQEIEYTSEGHVVHVVCPEDRWADNTPRPVCPHCFMVLPNSGVCVCRE